MILFVSHMPDCQYYLATHADDRFTPEQHGRMTWGGQRALRTGEHWRSTSLSRRRDVTPRS